MRDDRRELNKQLEMLLWAGLILLALHCYVELHSFFSGYGFASPVSDQILGKLTSGSKLFATPWTLKLLAGACIGAYGSASRGVKSTSLKAGQVIRAILIGLILYLGSTLMLRQNSQWLLELTSVPAISGVYLVATLGGVLYLLKGTQGINRLLGFKLGGDVFNQENETFPQEERKLENEYSVNLPTQYIYQGKTRSGWINLSAPFRGTLVMGTPGSGKSFGIINSVIRQHIAKGFSMYVYDYKFPTLSLVAYNAMLRHQKKLPAGIQFYCINFDDPRKSHRCNPLHPDYLPRIDHAFQSARTVLLNLNKTWITKQGEYFIESPINYVTALIWFLRQYDKGQYCTFPHLVELVSRNYRELLPILMDRPDIAAYMAPFASAYQGGAMDQLEGQISSAQIGLARLASPALYWTMSGNDFKLDINNPKAPKILCLGNNGELEDTYGAALGLFNFRILSLINKEEQHPSSIVVDELPTIYFKGIAKLIATGRSNRVAVTIGMQDYSQLEKDYGKIEADTIKNTCGNVISGQVTGQTAEAMQNRLGKNVQRKQSLNIQSEDTTHGISTELNFMAPAAKIGMLSQGWVVGVVADNAGQESERKAFHARVTIDEADFKSEQKVRELPNFTNFTPQNSGLDAKVQANYLKIKEDIANLVQSEVSRLNIKYKK
ncbi:conjugal transfer protein MobC [Nibrella saemangeumensis]|uniref:Conjugal transfer protein MobC n=1 Tax=Nibrella saemangeumensis TaxID=1084526 RepID=A0ABP8N0L1_9BACT